MAEYGTCFVCGKHVMKHWSARTFVGYVHYDHSPICKGGYNDNRELAARSESTDSEPILLGQYDPRIDRVPIGSIPCCLDHSKGRERCRA